MRRLAACSIGVERPVKVENCCLLKLFTMMVSGLPPATQIAANTPLSSASVNARCVPSVRVPVTIAAALVLGLRERGREAAMLAFAVGGGAIALPDGYAAFVLALPYPVLRTSWALGGSGPRGGRLSTTPVERMNVTFEWPSPTGAASISPAPISC